MAVAGAIVEPGTLYATGPAAEIAHQPNASAGEWKSMLLESVLAAGAFHLAWSVPAASGVVLVFAWELLRLSRCGSAAQRFRFGFLTGFLVFAPQLAWFWNIFGAVAISLWTVLSFFTGLFVALAGSWRKDAPHRRFRYWWLGAAVLWTGIEYFRSELYPLKFSWFSVGYVFSDSGGVLGRLGTYGIGFLVFALAAWTVNRSLARKILAVALLSAIAYWPLGQPRALNRSVNVAGVQLEFPADLEVPGNLDQVLAKFPDAQVVVLSEYTFDGPVPRHVRDWCRKNGRYLIAGGKEDLLHEGRSNFRNTAFVIGPSGETVFQQCKSVPIQFFNDGLPAREQRVWESPWGKIAIPVCYDLSYRNVSDNFITAGAEAFIVPFMDVTDWGETQHHQHARIAPMRAKEYGVSIFRVGSSGISQHVNAHGKIIAAAGFPGQGETLGGVLEFRKARWPLDRWLAPVCSSAVIIFLLARLALAVRTQLTKKASRCSPHH